MMPIVYVTENLINGKKYLGKCVHKKPFYLGSGIAIKNAIQKYGRNNFKKHIIFEVETIKEAANIEKCLSIALDIVNNSMWYNMKPGGDGGSTPGIKRSEETKKKISESKKGKPSWNKGLVGLDIVKHKEETKIKISQANKGQNNPYKGALNPKAKRVIFKNKFGKEFDVVGIGQFCRDYNLSFSNIMWRLRNNKDLPTKDGWSVRYA